MDALMVNIMASEVIVQFPEPFIKKNAGKLLVSIFSDYFISSDIR